jgi:hypothetical protein
VTSGTVPEGVPEGAPEGVQQFTMDHRPGSLPDGHLALVRELDSVRAILRQRGWLGQDPARYQGYGYGNVSARLGPLGGAAFLVSGSQTGHLDRLGPEGYTVVASCDFDGNRVTSAGPSLPSSEALTHAAVYCFDPDWRCVLHVHDPDLYQRAARSRLPATPVEATNGTVRLVHAIGALAAQGAFTTARAFWMRGHQDGLVSFGRDSGEALRALFELAV